MPTANENKAKLDYARGFLKAEPTMSDGDLNYYLDKKKVGILSGPEILALRQELGFTVVGRGRGRKVVTLAEANTGQEQTPTQPIAPQVPQPPPVRTPAAVVTPAPAVTVRASAQTPADKAADEALLADLVARIQQVMEREGIVYLEVPRRGPAKIHEPTVTTRTLAPTQTEAAPAH